MLKEKISNEQKKIFEEITFEALICNHCSFLHKKIQFKFAPINYNRNLVPVKATPQQDFSTNCRDYSIHQLLQLVRTSMQVKYNYQQNSQPQPIILVKKYEIQLNRIQNFINT